MILLESLKKNFSLIDKGLYYFRVKDCVLDTPSLATTIFACKRNYLTIVRDFSYYKNYASNHINVRGCSSYQAKVFS